MLDNMAFEVYNRDTKEVAYMSKTDPRNTNNSLIARKRKERGLTQAQLAKTLGCRSKDISEWESGKRQPRADYMVKIADALGCTIEDIVLGSNLEYDERDRLIVDRVIFGFKFGEWMFQIGNKWYIPTERRIYSSGMDLAKSMKAMPFFVESEDTRNEDGFPGPAVMLSLPISPREIPEGKLSIGRSITKKELGELRAKYNIADDDISSEYDVYKYRMYGKKNARQFRAIQIRIGDGVKAIQEKDILEKMGIEASAITPGVIEVRVD